MASPIKQESEQEDDKSSTTSLISSANLPIKYEEGSTTDPTPHNNMEHRNGDTRKRSFIEISEEEDGKNVDPNLELAPPELYPEDRLSSNQCLENSSMSVSASSRMPPNNYDSSGEEVEVSNATLEDPSLVVMGCSNCLIYVMVSEIEPKCPKCRSSVLIDEFRPKLDKKSRKF